MAFMGFFYFCFCVYHLVHLCCELSCCIYLQDPVGDSRKFILLVTCIIDIIIFKGRFLYRLNNTRLELCPANDIGKVNVSNVLQRGLNFNVLEGILNLVQSSIANEIIIQNKSCIESMNFGFVCCCFCGAGIQLCCFWKNLCGYHGTKGLSTNETRAHILGAVSSVFSLLVGYHSYSYAKKLGSC